MQVPCTISYLQVIHETFWDSVLLLNQSPAVQSAWQEVFLRKPSRSQIKHTVNEMNSVFLVTCRNW